MFESLGGYCSGGYLVNLFFEVANTFPGLTIELESDIPFNYEALQANYTARIPLPPVISPSNYYVPY